MNYELAKDIHQLRVIQEFKKVPCVDPDGNCDRCSDAVMCDHLLHSEIDVRGRINAATGVTEWFKFGGEENDG